jgi:hypothetical protein
MNADAPTYVSAVFILTALLTVGIFIFAIARAGTGSLPAKALIAFVLLWLVVQAVLATTGFFHEFDAMPPRVFAFGVLPFVLLTFIYLILFRNSFLAHLPLPVLTLLHVIRIPVELVLLWLAHSGQVPFEMTFEGRNFDILSGITAPLVYFLAFRNGRQNRPLLLVWNIAALALLVNIVTIAVLAFPTAFQMVGFDQPNVGVTYFPFIWLPAIIVPIVFFCHVASLSKLISHSDAA